MPQSHSAKLIIIALGLVMSAICTVANEELYELNCLNSTRCFQFERAGVITQCIGGICTCRNETTHEALKCIPRDDKLSNIITGPCPCTQPHTKCHEARDICYCTMDYRPSLDKRRCIPIKSGMNEPCEEHEQCQHNDTFAMCKDGTSECYCKMGFVEVDGMCKPDLVSLCYNHTNCKKHGDDSICHLEVDTCICETGYPNKRGINTCIPVAHYHDRCIDDGHCQMTLGLGGRCQQGRCDCNPKHYPYVVEPNTYPIKMACGRKTVRGQYCRVDEDCYEYRRPETRQLWDCVRGECECVLGPKAYKNGECTHSTDAASGKKLNVHLEYYTICVALYIFCVLLKSVTGA